MLISFKFSLSYDYHKIELEFVTVFFMENWRET